MQNTNSFKDEDGNDIPNQDITVEDVGGTLIVNVNASTPVSSSSRNPASQNTGMFRQKRVKPIVEFNNGIYNITVKGVKLV